MHWITLKSWAQKVPQLPSSLGLVFAQNLEFNKIKQIPEVGGGVLTLQTNLLQIHECIIPKD